MTDLSRYRRAELAHLPTPLEPMPTLTRMLRGAALAVKRDDCTGLAFGGNKVRQLEFHCGAALAEGADTLLITGAVQSNYVRTAAAAAARLGLQCEVQLEDRVEDMPSEYARSGNVLLDHLFGATVRRFPVGEDEGAADRALDERATQLLDEGRHPYVIHLGANHSPLGALGYVEAARELLDQAPGPVDAVVTASGSATTHAGLLVGVRAAGCAARVYGICVRRPEAAQRERVRLCVGLAEQLLGTEGLVRDQDIRVTDAYLGPGYGRFDAGTIEAMTLAARTEGLVLDPVYTGKAFAGLLGLVRGGEIRDDEYTVFIHTGGSPALFAYEPLLTPPPAVTLPAGAPRAYLVHSTDHRRYQP